MTKEEFLKLDINVGDEISYFHNFCRITVRGRVCQTSPYGIQYSFPNGRGYARTPFSMIDDFIITKKFIMEPNSLDVIVRMVGTTTLDKWTEKITTEPYRQSSLEQAAIYALTGIKEFYPDGWSKSFKGALDAYNESQNLLTATSLLLGEINLRYNAGDEFIVEAVNDYKKSIGCQKSTIISDIVIVDEEPVVDCAKEEVELKLLHSLANQHNYSLIPAVPEGHTIYVTTVAFHDHLNKERISLQSDLVVAKSYEEAIGATLGNYDVSAVKGYTCVVFSDEIYQAAIKQSNAIHPNKMNSFSVFEL